MPGDWQFAPDNDAVAHLDDVFRLGNAPRLAGMLRSLANPTWQGSTPCYLDLDWTEAFNDDGEYKTSDLHDIMGSASPGMPAGEIHSILEGSVRDDAKPDLHVEQFFWNADVLSGQDIGAAKDHTGRRLTQRDFADGTFLKDGGYAAEVVNALDAARMGKTRESAAVWTQVHDFFNGGARIWDDWKSDAAKPALKKITDVFTWFGYTDSQQGVFREKALYQLAAIVVSYAATIHAARVQLDNLMGQLVDQILQWNSQPRQDDSEFVGFCLDMTKDIIKADPIDAVFDVLKEVGSVVGPQNPDPLAQDQAYDKCDAYLRASEALMHDTVDKVNGLVAEMRAIRADRETFGGIHIPVWE